MAAEEHQNRHQYSIHLHQLSKQYGDAKILDQVNLSLTSAKTTAIVGPSGCGKSTLIKTINGLVTPSSGSILIGDEKLENKNIFTLRKEIGYAVQQIGLFPHLSTADNISLLAKLENWSPDKTEKRLHTLLQLTQLSPDLLNRHPHQLSGGQQQRVGLCRALMLEPRYLLLDEPFGAVDPITRIDIHEQFLALQKAEPRTTLLVTHDIKEAILLADLIAIMDKGKIVKSFSADEIASLNNPEQIILNTIRYA